MQYSDYRAAQEFITARSQRLMKDQKKGWGRISFPAQNYTVYDIWGRTFFVVGTNTFLEIIYKNLIEAVTTYPEYFGTKNAFDVIEAIYRIHPIDTLDWFAEFLRTEHFCYAIEIANGEIIDRILRIDLYRQLDQIDDSERYDFTGGIFHALKHFSYNGINLSTGNDKHDISRPDNLIGQAIKAFFFEEPKTIAANTFESFVELDLKYNLKFIFFYEEPSEVFFIKTVHKRRKPREGGKSVVNI